MTSSAFHRHSAQRRIEAQITATQGRDFGSGQRHVDRYGSKGPTSLELAFLLGAITAGLELHAAWLTIWLRAVPFGIIADPPPDPPAIDGFFDTLAGVLAALVLVLTIWRGRNTSADSRHDRPLAMHELLFARWVLAISLILPVYDERAAWSTVDIYHGPPLTWLVAALPLGLALACLLDRFRPQPDSLPPAPGS